MFSLAWFSIATTSVGSAISWQWETRRQTFHPLNCPKGSQRCSAANTCAANKAPSTSHLDKLKLKRPQGVTDGGDNRHEALGIAVAAWGNCNRNFQEFSTLLPCSWVWMETEAGSFWRFVCLTQPSTTLEAASSSFISDIEALSSCTLFPCPPAVF